MTKRGDEGKDAEADTVIEPPPSAPDPVGDDPEYVEETWEEYLERIGSDPDIVEPAPQPPEEPADPDDPDV